MNAEQQILKEALDDTSCPALEDLWWALDDSSAHPRREEILSHLEACVRCQVEAGLAEEFGAGEARAGEQDDVEWIEARLRARDFGMEPQPRSRLIRFPKIFSGSGSGWKPLAAIAAMALLVVVALQWPGSQPSLPESATPSGIVRSQMLQLTRPVGLQPQPPQEWNWQAVEGAALYQVRFLEVDGAVLLIVETNQTTLRTPPALTSVLRPGKRILWQVTALNRDGARLAASQPNAVWLEVSGSSSQ